MGKGDGEEKERGGSGVGRIKERVIKVKEEEGVIFYFMFKNNGFIYVSLS